jgi:hypothetical protein
VAQQRSRRLAGLRAPGQIALGALLAPASFALVLSASGLFTGAPAAGASTTPSVAAPPAPAVTDSEPTTAPVPVPTTSVVTTAPRGDQSTPPASPPAPAIGAPAGSRFGSPTGTGSPTS